MSSSAPKFSPDQVHGDSHDTDLSELEPDFGIYDDSTVDAPWEHPSILGQVNAADRKHASLKPPAMPSDFGSGVRNVHTGLPLPDGTHIAGIIPDIDGDEEVTQEHTGRMNVIDFPPELRAVVAESRFAIDTVVDPDKKDPSGKNEK
jgi:hypothetical protein